jgi:hypothetical protein
MVNERSVAVKQADRYNMAREAISCEKLKAGTTAGISWPVAAHWFWRPHKKRFGSPAMKFLGASEIVLRFLQ